MHTDISSLCFPLQFKDFRNVHKIQNKTRCKILRNLVGNKCALNLVFFGHLHICRKHVSDWFCLWLLLYTGVSVFFIALCGAVHLARRGDFCKCISNSSPLANYHKSKLFNQNRPKNSRTIANLCIQVMQIVKLNAYILGLVGVVLQSVEISVRDFMIINKNFNGFTEIHKQHGFMCRRGNAAAAAMAKML